MSKLEGTKKMIRAVLLSSKEGIPAYKMQKDYKDLTGGGIPYEKLGFSTLHEFILSIPDVVKVRQSHQEVTYHAVADESTQHIQKMVSKQRSKKKKVKSYKGYKIPHRAYTGRYIPTVRRSLPPSSRLTLPKSSGALKSKPHQMVKLSHSYRPSVTHTKNLAHVPHIKAPLSRENLINVRKGFLGDTPPNAFKVPFSKPPAPERRVIFGTPKKHAKKPVAKPSRPKFKNPLMSDSSESGPENIKVTISNSKRTAVQIVPPASNLPPILQKLQKDKESVAGWKSEIVSFDGDSSMLKPIDDVIKNRIKTILHTHPDGVLSLDLPDLYYEAHGCRLPEYIVMGLECGYASDVATVKRLSKGIREKKILLPVQESSQRNKLRMKQNQEGLMKRESSKKPRVCRELASSSKTKNAVQGRGTEVESDATRTQRDVGSSMPRKFSQDDIRIKSWESTVVEWNQDAEEIDEIIKHRIKKLLSVSSHGIASIDLSRLYMETFHSELADRIVMGLECGLIKNVATIEKWTCGNREKILFYPVRSETEYKRPKYSAPPKRKVVKMPKADKLSPDVEYEAFVSHINDCSNFYVQLLSYSDDLHKISDVAKTVSYGRTENIVPGTEILSSFEPGRRGRIISVLGKEVEVYHTDFGDTRRLTLEEITPIPPEILKIPELAVTCSLYKQKEPESGWSERSSLQFQQLCLEKKIKIKVNFVNNFGPFAEQGQVVHDVTCYLDNFNVNGRLLHEELSQSVLSNSVPSSRSQSPVREEKQELGDHNNSTLPSIETTDASRELIIKKASEQAEQSSRSTLNHGGSRTKPLVVKTEPTEGTESLVVRVKQEPSGIYESVKRMVSQLNETSPIAHKNGAKTGEKADIGSIHNETPCMGQSLSNSSSPFAHIKVSSPLAPRGRSKVSPRRLAYSPGSIGGKSTRSMRSDSTKSLFEEISDTSSSSGQQLETGASPVVESSVKISKMDPVMDNIGESNHVNQNGYSSNDLSNHKSEVDRGPVYLFSPFPWSYGDYGKILDVIVTNVLSPGSIQMTPVLKVSDYSKLTRSMNAYYKANPTPVEDIEENSLYAAPCRMNGGIKWQRVKICKKVLDLASVFLIDCGLFDCVPVRKICNLSVHFVDKPPLSINGRLAGIRPKHNTTECLNLATKMLENRILGKQLVAHILKVTHEEGRTIYEVCLCDMTYQEEWINDLMVDEWKLADYVV